MLSYIPEVLEQHADDAVSLFMLRERAADGLATTLPELTKLDNRLEANLQGLCLAGEASWELCNDLLRCEGAAGAFTAAVVAFSTGQEDSIRSLWRTADDRPEFLPSMVKALSWLPLEEIHIFVQKLLPADILSQRLACAAFISHGVDPGIALTAALDTSDPRLKAALLRGAGELGRVDLLALLRREMSSEEESCRFWAAWSTLLLTASQQATQIVTNFTLVQGPYQEDAVAALARVCGADGSSLSEALDCCCVSGRLLATMVKVRGRVDGVASLIDLMSSQTHARYALEAFTHITGAAINDLNLSTEKPHDFRSGPIEDPQDEQIELDADDRLPWPDSVGVASWWEEHKVMFDVGTRYLCGMPISEHSTQAILLNGRQGQRSAAAFGCASLQPRRPVFNIRAPGFRQADWLNPASASNIWSHSKRTSWRSSR